MDLDGGLENKIIEWLSNIVGVPTQEIGLLAGDAVRRWRVNNQLNTLAKAIEKSKKLKLPLKVVSPKLICPLLENCSLEDDEFMQDKWANLLTNMLDSEKNIQNHVFPFILSQISKSEFLELQTFHLKYCSALAALDKKIDLKYNETMTFLKEVDYRLTEKQREIKTIKLSNKLRQLNQKRRDLTFVTLDELEEYEIANLQRLGIITALSVNTAFSDPILKEINIEHLAYEHYITELGELFMKASIDLETHSD